MPTDPSAVTRNEHVPEDMAATRKDAVPGLDRATVQAWLLERLDGLVEPLAFVRLTGGRSNLTFRVSDPSGTSVILRRPPDGPTQPSAHDMLREARILRGLRDSDVPVPTVLATEETGRVTGAPFYVMDDVEGRIFRSRADVSSLTTRERRSLSESLVRTLASMHMLDVTQGPLASLGRPEDFIDRQLRRFGAQLETDQTRDYPIAREIHRRLAKQVPSQQRISLVHGDYRLDNIVIGTNLDVAAVLDWELCTRGDPLADLAMLEVYWLRPGHPEIPTLSSPTDLPGFVDHAELESSYASATGLDLGNLPYYRAFALWRLAIILDGVFVRYSHGAYDGDSEERFEALGRAVPDLLTRSAALLES